MNKKKREKMLMYFHTKSPISLEFRQSPTSYLLTLSTISFYYFSLITFSLSLPRKHNLVQKTQWLDKGFKAYSVKVSRYKPPQFLHSSLLHAFLSFSLSPSLSLKKNGGKWVRKTGYYLPFLWFSFLFLSPFFFF